MIVVRFSFRVGTGRSNRDRPVFTSTSLHRTDSRSMSIAGNINRPTTRGNTYRKPVQPIADH